MATQQDALNSKTVDQNDEFQDFVQNDMFQLDAALEWITANLDIDEVFSEARITAYIEDAGWVRPTEFDCEDK